VEESSSDACDGWREEIVRREIERSWRRAVRLSVCWSDEVDDFERGGCIIVVVLCSLDIRLAELQSKCIELSTVHGGSASSSWLLDDAASLLLYNL